MKRFAGQNAMYRAAVMHEERLSSWIKVRRKAEEAKVSVSRENKKEQQ